MRCFGSAVSAVRSGLTGKLKNYIPGFIHISVCFDFEIVFLAITVINNQIYILASIG